MLQPRVINTMAEGRRRTRSRTSHLGLLYAIFAFALLSGFALCQENHENQEQIEAERVKRDLAGDGDNQKLNKDARSGRYLNVKPVIGLLTSTARTFIQDGVTTEYATEILGTTLDNGRVYAQLLTKSSLVLYNKPSSQVQEPLKKTRLPFEMDERNKWNLEQNLGEIDRFVVKNTDYISPNEGIEMFTVFPSKVSQESFTSVWNPVNADIQNTEKTTEQVITDDRVKGLQDIPRYSELEVINLLDPLPAARERKISAYNNINLDVKNEDRSNKAISFNTEKENTVVSVKKSTSKAIEPAKINPNIKLPTFTVKNEFSPIFYYIDNVESKTEKSGSSPNYLKNAKKLFGHKDDQKPLKTFTYYGFADFTTIVGDTVIVFSPSTANEFVKETRHEITPSAKPEVQPNVATKIKTFLSSDLNMVTKTMFGHHLNMETALPTFVMDAKDLGRASKALTNDQGSLKSVLYEKPITEPEQQLKSEDKFSRVIASLKEGLFSRQKTQFALSKEVIQPSETSYSTIQRTHATDKLKLNEETIRDDKVFSIKATEPLTLIRPSTVKEITDEEVDSATVTEGISTVSDENVTEESETGPTTESEEALASTDDTLSTPVDEDQRDEIEDNSGDATCTGGIIPVSTMTTAYKTLTYLTTFFIPVDETGTTTSIQSSKMVLTETGYLTNLICKTEEVIDISPTAKVNVQITPTKSIQNVPKKERIPETKVEDVTEDILPVLTTTQKSQKHKKTENEHVTSEKYETTTNFDKILDDVTENKITSNDKTTLDFLTTESVISTSESHVEMSFTTEESTVSLDTRINLETTTEKKQGDADDIEEGEVDLIFKTLYTTYTYFTTYFQESTSTVTSRKSVITNIITSTLDLSEIDPSVFNAIESSDYLFKATQKEELDVQPTSVGVGRPTQTFSLNSIIDLVNNRQVIDSVQNDPVLNSKIGTPKLNDDKFLGDIKADAVKTFYTTYTFFTTLYVEQDINICSRSEVYTNYVGPGSLIPTKTSDSSSLNTKTNEIDFKNCRKISADLIKKPSEEKDDEDLDTELSKPKYHVYTSIDRPNKKNQTKIVETENLKEIALKDGDTMSVTDVKRSYSKGEHQIIDNGVLDDQVSSESNIDEIMPSPTLLLQTSYTTFTYFTTMYIGKDSSKVKSRLETVTNVVTETLDPKSPDVEETNLPITYYTTFTYWTTLYKDKTTTITSREEIISNVVAPNVTQPTSSPIDTSPIEISTVQISASSKQPSDQEKDINPSTTVNDLLMDDGKATFFTTYTYFTTYYVGNNTEIRSSLETITNVVDNTKDLVDENQLARAVGKQPPVDNLFESDEKPIIKTTKLADEIIPTKVVGENAIVPTHIVGTYADNVVLPVKEKESEVKILSSQVAVISGDSTIITNILNKTESKDDVTTKIDDLIITTPGITVIEGSVTEPTTPQDLEDQDGSEDDEEEEEGENGKKKSRLTFSSRKRTFTPVIRPFVSRSRPTFSPRRGSLASGATTITRSDFTPTITATPALKSVKSSGFGGNRNQASSAYPRGQTSGGRRFSRVSSITPTSTTSAQRNFGRGRTSDIQQNARRGGFRTSSVRPSASDISTRGPRIRPTLSSRYRGSKQTATTTLNNDEETTSVAENIGSSPDDTESSTPSSDGVSESGFRRTTNPLLRFRRPPFTRTPVSTTPKTTAQTTTRRSAVNRGRGATTTTPKPTQKTTTNPLFALRNRQRPNSLFPPRGLIKQPEPQLEEELNPDKDAENEENQDLDEEDEEDSDYESSIRQESQVTTTTTTTAAPRRISNVPVIRPFGFRQRTKRQTTDYGTRRSYSNFRRPTSRTSTTSEPEPEIDYTSTQRLRSQGRFLSRNNIYQNTTPQTTQRTTLVTKASTNSRQSYILRRDGDTRTTSSVTQRPTFRSRSSRPVSTSSPNSRPKAPRLKTQTEPPRTNTRNSARQRPTNRARTTSRYRSTSNDIIDNNYVNYQIPNDGKLTITHKLPIEVTIPVVNGKLTEYKNVLTAKPSIEILQPNQYSTTKNAFGSQYIVLVSESSQPAENGATRVIQFILHETPTTSIIFTPTTIRGRKTSFSHVIPSTVYDVERVTSTILPQINPNVPLANILLSQLLLGNIGMPQPINPLLALQGQQGVAGSPTTEFKTKTTTYVTTVTDAKSTVLPITFRGKEILTTIIESSVDVITATEFITETVVVTPTVALPNQNQNQLNSILLLLQQPQFQQPQQTVNPLIGLNPDLNLLQNTPQLYGNDLYNNPKPEVLDVKSPEDYLADYIEDEITEAPKRNPRRKLKTKKPTPAQQTSIVTLYVSGRTPGEFSTVLSTIVVDETQNIQKREAIYLEELDVYPSNLPSYSDILMTSQSDSVLDSFLMPGMNELEQNTITQAETQSLESIIGKVSKFVAIDNPSSITEITKSDPTTVYIVKESNIDDTVNN